MEKTNIDNKKIVLEFFEKIRDINSDKTKDKDIKNKEETFILKQQN